MLDGVKLAVERVTGGGRATTACAVGFVNVAHNKLCMVDAIPPDPTPKKIVWELTPDLQHAIRKGESMLSDLVSTVLRALLLVLCTSRSATW